MGKHALELGKKFNYNQGQWTYTFKFVITCIFWALQKLTVVAFACISRHCCSFWVSYGRVSQEETPSQNVPETQGHITHSLHQAHWDHAHWEAVGSLVGALSSFEKEFSLSKKRRASCQSHVQLERDQILFKISNYGVQPDQYNLEYAPYHSICRLFVHFLVRIHFWAAATIERVVWKHCNQFLLGEPGVSIDQKKIFAERLWTWLCHNRPRPLVFFTEFCNFTSILVPSHDESPFIRFLWPDSSMQAQDRTSDELIAPERYMGASPRRLGRPPRFSAVH